MRISQPSVDVSTTWLLFQRNTMYFLICNCLYSYIPLMMLDANVICLSIWSLFIYLSTTYDTGRVPHGIRDWLLLNGPTGQHNSLKKQKSILKQPWSVHLCVGKFCVRYSTLWRIPIAYCTVTTRHLIIVTTDTVHHKQRSLPWMKANTTTV
jgi:hypothetical protein